MWNWIKSWFAKSKDAKEITLVYPPTAPKPVVLKVPEVPKETIYAPPTPVTENATPNPITKIYGIDVSHHNGQVDWKKVALDNIKFVFLKATEGASYTDPTFIRNAQDAKDAGLLVGAYHFLRDGDNGEAQANHFLKQTSLVNIDLPLVLDWERSEAKNEAKAFLDVLSASNKKTPIIYGGNILRGENLDSSFLKYPLWLAQYGPKADKIPKPWTKYTFWQYTDSGSVSGINGKCDMNRFNGTIEELKALAL